MPFQRDIIVIASVLAIIPILSTRAYSDELGDHCDAILQSAATNVDIDMLSNEYLNALYDKTCTSTGSARSDSGSIGFGDFKLGYGTSGTSASNFCAKHKNTRFEHTTSNSYKQNVSGSRPNTAVVRRAGDRLQRRSPRRGDRRQGPRSGDCGIAP
jgi:hypothetical protein